MKIFILGLHGFLVVMATLRRLGGDIIFAQINNEVFMIKITVNENIIEFILEKYKKNNESDYVEAKSCQINHEGNMSKVQLEKVSKAEALCLIAINDDLRFF